MAIYVIYTVHPGNQALITNGYKSYIQPGIEAVITNDYLGYVHGTAVWD